MECFIDKYKYIFSIFIISFTIYIILDTLYLSEGYVVVENESTNYENIDSEVTSNTYKSDDIDIEIKTYYEYDTYIYVAFIKCDISYIKSAFAKSTYGKNIVDKTSNIASDVKAILAINGDYYGVQEKGYVLRNSTIYRSSKVSEKEDLVIYSDGEFEIINESEVDINDIDNAYQIFSFGPTLINNGNIVISKNTEVAKSMNSNPRTAIGKISEDTYVFVVSDGRTKESSGLTLYELATFMREFDVDILYNLDGGGSSTMYFNGSIVNKPTTNGKSIEERSVSDIIYVGY